MATMCAACGLRPPERGNPARLCRLCSNAGRVASGLSGVRLVPVDELPAGSSLMTRRARPGIPDVDHIDGYALGLRRFEVYEFASGRRQTYERVVDGAGGDEPRGGA